MVSYGRVHHIINVILLLFASTVSAEEQGILRVLKALRQRLGRPLIFIILDENKITLEDLSDNENTNLYKKYELDDPNDEKGFNENADDEAYLLYNVLKESNHGFPAIKAARAKELLTPALRARCFKLEKCLDRCPTMKYECKISCQQVFDNLDACASVKKNDECRGRTMPPKWRLLRNSLNIQNLH